MCHQLVEQDARLECFGAFERGVEAEELFVVVAALFDARSLRSAEIVQERGKLCLTLGVDGRISGLTL